MAAGGKVGPPRKSAKEILLELLDADESGVDALVTKHHAEDLAEGLADAMERLGYEIREKRSALLDAVLSTPLSRSLQPIVVRAPHPCPNCGMVS